MAKKKAKKQPAAKGEKAKIENTEPSTQSKSLLKGFSYDSIKKVSSKTRSIMFDPKSDMPTKGSQLLDWVRRRMSYTVDDTVDSDEEEVHEIIPEKKKKHTVEDKHDKRASLKSNDSSSSKKRGKTAQRLRSESIEKIIKLPRPPGLEDPIVSIIKAKKEAKRLAEEQLRIEVESTKHGSETSKPKEKKKKKAKSKKGKVKVAKTEEPAKIDNEMAAQAAEMLKKQEEEEKEVLQNQLVILQMEQAKRLEGLKLTLDVIKSIQDVSRKIQKKHRKENYWRLYVECGKLPIVNHISDMTMYLQSWRNVLVETTPEEAAERTKDVLKLLQVLDEFIIHPPKSQQRLENYKWLRNLFRAQLREMMEHMTFKLLRTIDQNMNHINLYIGDYNFKDENFILSLWLKFRMPTPLFNPRRPAPPPISITVEQLNLTLDLPPSINGEGMVIRIMYLTYDHLSDTSKGFEKPAKPEYYNLNLVDVVERDWKVMRKYRVVARYRAQYEQELRRHELNIQEKANYKPFSQNAPPPDLPPLSKFQLPDVDVNGEIPDVPVMKLDPTPEEYAEEVEESEHKEMRQHLLYQPQEHEVNLRKYLILGGLHVINLFYQPPQPQHLVTMVLTVATFVLPKCLTEVPFYEEFKTLPSTGEQKTPEELEAALKLQEECFAKLISITLTLPSHVMYLEPPVVCMWEEEHEIWSTKDIQDVKHNEEKGTVSFRTGRFGIFGLATFRYGNLPYQTWDIRPDEDNNIVFLLTAAVLLFEFKIKDSLITVTQFQNGPNNALRDIVSKSFTIDKLARILREGGVNIFPDHDAFCYVEGSCEKHWPTEYMCYYNMAQLSACYNFSWSRWNASEGYRSIVMQMRIFNPELHTQKGQSLVLLTPSKAAFINCAEVTPIFCRDPVEGSKFCCNLWYLMKATSTIYVRNKLSKISQETVHTVAQLLIGTRILSFS